MAKNKPLVIVTRRLPDAVEARMRALFDARLNLSDRPMDASELMAAARQADVLVPTVGDRIDADVIAAAGERLRLIANFGVGFNHIDIRAAHEKGVTVTNTPGVLTDATADMTIALLLAATRRIMEAAKILREGQFEGWSPTWIMGMGLTGKRLGIVGMGRIGQAVAKRAAAFGLDIHYHNRNRLAPAIEANLQATYWESLDPMLSGMDIVSINCPYTAGTHHLISAERLSRMKPSAYIVNTARGEIIDEAALASALEEGRLAGAGLDVFEHEPKVHPKLLKLTNVALTPHLGSGTVEARIAMGEKVIRNIKSFVDGEVPPDRVLPAP